MGALEKGREGTNAGIQELQSLRELFTCSNYSMSDIWQSVRLLYWDFMQVIYSDCGVFFFFFSDCSEFPMKFQGSIVLGYVKTV